MKWNDIPIKSMRDLMAWFNRTGLSDRDRQLLASLYSQRRFKAWDCPRCGDRVYRGNPLDWSEFGGVLQVDYTSYPAKKGTVKWCNSCRAWHSKEA